MGEESFEHSGPLTDLTVSEGGGPCLLFVTEVLASTHRHKTLWVSDVLLTVGFSCCPGRKCMLATPPTMTAPDPGPTRGKNRAFRRSSRPLAAGSLGCVALASVLSFSSSAWALQGGEDASELPVLLDKRFALEGRSQVSLLFTTAIVTKLVEDLGVYGTYQYNFTEQLAAGVSTGFFFGDETSITDAIRGQGVDPANPASGDPLADLYQMFWMVSADFIVTPLYGKISFASEVNPSFDIYGLVGAGAGQVRRVAGVTPDAQGRLSVNGYDTSFTPIFSLGIGMHFYMTKLLALRIEIRDYFFPEPAAGVGGLTWNLHAQAGLQLTFGGDD